MCGVILNEIPENSTLLTAGGSFWTNNSTTFLDNVSEQEKKDLNIRSYCNACGYESIALVPIKYDNIVTGLLQLNDRKIDKFNEELIYYLEMVGSQLGISIRNRKMYTDLLMKYNELQAACIK
jgi:GAF domain-containing protein